METNQIAPTPKLPLMSRIFAACEGRHTAFVVFFAIAGNIMHWFHRLDGTYISYMTVLMGFIAGHSVQENYFKKDGPQS